MQDITLFSNKFKVRISELDSQGRVRLPALIEYLQETAASHAALLKFHNSDMMGYNLGWVLSKLYLELNSLIEQPGDSITVESWASGTNRIFANRDFRLLAASGEEIGRAASSWLVIDLNSRKLTRSPTLFKEIEKIKRSPIITHNFATLPRPEKHDFEKSFSAGYNQLDINQHVNNVRYVEWILETIPHETLKNLSPRRLELNFMAESILDDQVSSRTKREPSEGTGFSHSLHCINRDKELVRAQTEWQ